MEYRENDDGVSANSSPVTTSTPRRPRLRVAASDCQPRAYVMIALPGWPRSIASVIGVAPLMYPLGFRSRDVIIALTPLQVYKVVASFDAGDHDAADRDG